VQFIFAGQAHPRDEPGKKVLQQIAKLMRHMASEMLARLSRNLPTSLSSSKTTAVFAKGALMAKKIDPLNKKDYGAVSAVLAVFDVKAVALCQKAFEHVLVRSGK
jgi:hypothetical protein